MANGDIKLDIYGEPEYSPHECFKCGELYSLSDSTAPVEYRETYCSIECYTKDHLLMEQQIESERSTNPNPNPIQDSGDINSLNNPEIESPGYTTSKIGDFILKVKKQE